MGSTKESVAAETRDIPLPRQISGTPSDVDVVAPPPNIASWADECLSSRQASEFVYQSRKATEIEFENPIIQINDGEADEVQSQAGISGEVTPSWRSNVEGDHIRSHSNEEHDDWADGASHVSRAWRHDPYAIEEPCLILYACNCNECLIAYNEAQQPQYPLDVEEQNPHSLASTQREFVASGPDFSSTIATVHSEAPAALGPMDDFLWDPAFQQALQQPNHNTPSKRQHAHPYGIHNQQQGVHYSHQNHQPVVPHVATQFMPPPPPPRVAHRIFHQSGAQNGQYERTMIRWYTHVEVAQERWVSRTDRCPAPPLINGQCAYSFEQWADMVSSWWFAHFEHLQRRQKPTGCYGYGRH